MKTDLTGDFSVALRLLRRHCVVFAAAVVVCAVAAAFVLSSMSVHAAPADATPSGDELSLVDSAPEKFVSSDTSADDESVPQSEAQQESLLDESIPQESNPSESGTQSGQDITVTVLPSEGGTITVSDPYAGYGDTVVVTASPDEGWKLVVILRDGIISPAQFTMDSEKTTVTAVFRYEGVSVPPDESTADTSDESGEVYHNISVIQTSNGTVSVSTDRAKHGEKVVITAVPDSGYEVFRIFVNDASIGSSSFLMPEIDCVVEVEFRRIGAVSTVESYDIIISDTVHGRVEASLDSAQEGARITVTVTPDDGYILSSISFNDRTMSVAASRFTFEMPAADVTITAVFELAADHVSAAVESEVADVEISVWVPELQTSAIGQTDNTDGVDQAVPTEQGIPLIAVAAPLGVIVCAAFIIFSRRRI